MRPLLLACALLGLAGCTSPLDGAAPPPPGAGGSAGGTLFVLVEHVVSVEGPPGRRLGGDFGPHCETATYTLQPLRLELHQQPGQAAPPGTVVRDHRTSFRDDDVDRGASSGLVRGDVDPARATVPLGSPFDPARVVATLTFDRGAVAVDGKALAPGASAPARLDHTVQRDGAAFRVQETLQVRNLGGVAPALRTIQGLCD